MLAGFPNTSSCDKICSDYTADASNQMLEHAKQTNVKWPPFSFQNGHKMATWLLSFNLAQMEMLIFCGNGACGVYICCKCCPNAFWLSLCFQLIVLDPYNEEKLQYAIITCLEHYLWISVKTSVHITAASPDFYSYFRQYFKCFQSGTASMNIPGKQKKFYWLNCMVIFHLLSMLLFLFSSSPLVINWVLSWSSTKRCLSYRIIHSRNEQFSQQECKERAFCHCWKSDAFIATCTLISNVYFNVCLTTPSTP